MLCDTMVCLLLQARPGARWVCQRPIGVGSGGVFPAERISHPRATERQILIHRSLLQSSHESLATMHVPRLSCMLDARLLKRGAATRIQALSHQTPSSRGQQKGNWQPQASSAHNIRPRSKICSASQRSVVWLVLNLVLDSILFRGIPAHTWILPKIPLLAKNTKALNPPVTLNPPVSSQGFPTREAKLPRAWSP